MSRSSNLPIHLMQEQQLSYFNSDTAFEQVGCTAQAANYTLDPSVVPFFALIMSPLSQGSCVSRQSVPRCTRITLAEVCMAEW